jgi:glycosyltransferase involved in cell wall biosynthesis
MAERPLLSIVVTSYTTDRLKGNHELLESIKAQTLTAFETIYVVERSKELFQNIETYVQNNKIPNVKMIFNNGETGASAARNLGMKDAKGEIIAFIDDDVVLASDWAEEMIKTYDDSIIGVSGTALPLWECPQPKWLPEELYWIVGCTSWLNSKEVKEIRNVWTMNSAFGREIVDRGIYFSQNIGPSGGSMKGREKNRLSEDLEFSMRARKITGKRIVFNPKVKVQHRVTPDRLTWNYIIQWSYWIGSSRKTLKRLYPESNSKSSVLSTEYELLNSIFKRLFPSILKGLFIDPINAGHKFALTVTVLSCVVIGYARSSILYSGGLNII